MIPVIKALYKAHAVRRDLPKHRRAHVDVRGRGPPAPSRPHRPRQHLRPHRRRQRWLLRRRQELLRPQQLPPSRPATATSTSPATWRAKTPPTSSTPTPASTSPRSNSSGPAGTSGASTTTSAAATSSSTASPPPTATTSTSTASSTSSPHPGHGRSTRTAHESRGSVSPTRLPPGGRAAPARAPSAQGAHRRAGPPHADPPRHSRASPTGSSSPATSGPSTTTSRPSGASRPAERLRQGQRHPAVPPCRPPEPAADRSRLERTSGQGRASPTTPPPPVLADRARAPPSPLTSTRPCGLLDPTTIARSPRPTEPGPTTTPPRAWHHRVATAEAAGTPTTGQEVKGHRTMAAISAQRWRRGRGRPLRRAGPRGGDQGRCARRRDPPAQGEDPQARGREPAGTSRDTTTATSPSRPTSSPDSSGPHEATGGLRPARHSCATSSSSSGASTSAARTSCGPAPHCSRCAPAARPGSPSPAASATSAPAPASLANTDTVVRYLFEEGRDLTDGAAAPGHAARRCSRSGSCRGWSASGVTARGAKCALVDHPSRQVRRELHHVHGRSRSTTPPGQRLLRRLTSTYPDPDLAWGDAAVPDDTSWIQTPSTCSQPTRYPEARPAGPRRRPRLGP